MSKVKCESCGKSFNRDNVVEQFDERYGDGTYEYCYQWNNFCFDCAVEIYEENNGDGTYSDGSNCSNCQGSLSGGSLTMPWEDGDNSSAYIICPHCGMKNYVDGYGID